MKNFYLLILLIATTFTSIQATNNANIITSNVEMAIFRGKVKYCGTVQLEWGTYTEKNNSHFEIEHSEDGVNFVNIDKVNGAGTSKETLLYNFEHKNASTDINYYRLKQVSFDGTFMYTDVIEVLSDGCKTQVQFTAGPVPSKGELQIDISGGIQSNKKEIMVFNVVGQLKMVQNVNDGETISHIDLSELERGFYFIRIKDGEDFSDVQKIILN